MTKHALVLLATGFEELETVTPITIMRRAGIDVTVASTEDKLLLVGRNKIAVAAETKLSEINPSDFDILVIPGGPAFKSLRKNKEVLKLIQTYENKSKPIAAICAAPLVLKDAGVLENKKYTAHFSTANELPNLDTSQAVIKDGNTITSQGAGTALAFAYAIVEELSNSTNVEKVKRDICHL